MIERDYDKLIGRFKELSDNPKLDYHPEDWTAVEQMLDNRDPKRPLLWLWLSGFLLISAVGAWFLLSDADASNLAEQGEQIAAIAENRVNLDQVSSGDDIVGQHTGATTQQAENTKQQAIENTASVGGEISTTQSIKSETEDAVQGGEADTKRGILTSALGQNDSNRDALDNGAQIGDAIVNRSTRTSDVGQNYFNGDAGGFRPNRSNSRPLSENENVVSEHAVYSSSADQSVIEHDGQAEIDQTSIEQSGNSDIRKPNTSAPASASEYVLKSSLTNSRTIEKSNNSISAVPAINIAPLALNDITCDGTMTFEHEPREILEEHNPKWIFNANVGVETAQSPLGGRSDVDYSVGLRLGYIASSKLSFNVGANYIREAYQAQGEDYIPPVGFWSASEGVPPEIVQAVCDMLDLSIGASYHFTDVQSNGLVARVNLLSNFMLREEYDYQFDESSDDFTGVFSGENHNFASQIELSTVYKLRTGGGYFIDAGPYLKLPLSGVGHGNVRLTSVGIRIGVSLVK